jgi:hypothetical protein
VMKPYISLQVVRQETRERSRQSKRDIPNKPEAVDVTLEAERAYDLSKVLPEAHRLLLRDDLAIPCGRASEE